MQVHTKYFYFCLIFYNLYKVLSVELNETEVSTEATLNESTSRKVEENGESYMKYFAFTGIYYPDTYAFLWNGVVIRPDLVLTAQIFDIETFFKEMHPEKAAFKNKAYHVVMTGASGGFFEKYPKERVTRCQIGTNMTNTDSVKDAQLTILHLRHPLRLGSDKGVIQLTTKKYPSGSHCITVSDGAHHKNPLRAIKVEITEEDTCLSKDRFCVAIIDKRFLQNTSHCEAFYGGEPIICEGTLVGIVNAYRNNSDCHPDETRPSTSIYQYRQWIDNFMLHTVQTKSIGLFLRPFAITLVSSNILNMLVYNVH